MPDLDALYRDADQLKDEGKLPEAVAKLEELLSLDSTHVLAHLALAVLYGRVGQHDLAVEKGRRACELEPKESFNFTALSVTYQRAWQATQRMEYIQLAEDAKARSHQLEGH
ncbi:MAG: scaffolding protein [Planctomycetota bacterium]|nr:scaffolding protein [Planctomycetota bacterium]MDA1179478.1 scaffolding protein [Planctomycetota bacterium]